MLGDLVERALSAVGITEDRVEEWLGRPCGCSDRKEKLNAVGYWAKHVFQGHLNGAKECLERIMRT